MAGRAVVLLAFLAMPPRVVGGSGGAVDREAEGPAEPVRYALVVTGGELLEGTIADSHTGFLARTLRSRGGSCVISVMVDDQPAELERVLGFVSRLAPLVIVTGGLGPTTNDITRETLARFTRIGLREAPEVVADLGRRLGVAPEQLRENLRRQARVPERGRWLANRIGTAVGLVFEAEPAVIVALPGPPRELQPMVRDEMLPWMEERFNLHPAGCSLTLRFVGLGQSAIDQKLQEAAVVSPGTVVGSVFDGSRVDFTFSRLHDTPADRRSLDEIVERARAVLGERLYATGSATLEEAALRPIRERGGTVAFVEAATGGALANSLTRQPALRPLLAGCWVGGDLATLARLLRVEASRQGTSSVEVPEVLRRLGDAARRDSGAAWVIVVGEEPEARSVPFSRIPVAFGGPGGQWETLSLELRDSAETGRANLVNEVLDRWRRMPWR